MSSSEINSTNININPPSSSKLLPAPAPVVNAWGTRALLSTPSNPVAAAAAATTFPAQPVATKNNNPSHKTANTKSNEVKTTNGTSKFQKKAKEEQWPSAQEAVSEKQTSNNHAQPVSTLKELKKGPNNREKWVPYDATIVISSSTGTNKKNGVTGERLNDNGATSNGFNNKPSQSKSKSKKSKQNKNKESKDGNGKEPKEPRGREGSEPTKRSNGTSKYNNYGNDQKRQGNSLSKQGNPDNNSKLEKIAITSATCIESNASDASASASATIDSGASETTHATTEDGDITLSKNLEANDTLPSDSTTDLRPKLKSHPNQPQHHQIQQHFAPQLLSQQPQQFFQQGIPKGQFVQQQYLPPPQFQQSQQFIINNNKNSKHRNSEPFHGNSRSISGGSTNSRRYSNSNSANGNRKHFNNANNYRHSISGTTFNHGPDLPFAYPHVNYGYLPIMNQQNIGYAYGQPAVGHILPQPRSRSSSQAAVKENFITTPFQGQPQQQSFLSTQQFNGAPYDGPHVYQPFMEDPVSTIANQLNYYFSIDNLVRDTHLRKQMNSLGFLPVAKIMEFRRVQILTQGNLQLLCDAIATLPQLELRGTKVRLKEDYSKWIFKFHQRDVAGKVEEPETQQVSEKTPSETVTQG